MTGSSQDQQFHDLERVERLRRLRNWSLGLGVVALVLSLTAVGVIGIGNPKSASSIFIALAGDGFFRWAVIPLVAAGFALLIVGALLHGLSRRHPGEV